MAIPLAGPWLEIAGVASDYSGAQKVPFAVFGVLFIDADTQLRPSSRAARMLADDLPRPWAHEIDAQARLAVGDP